MWGAIQLPTHPDGYTVSPKKPTARSSKTKPDTPTVMEWKVVRLMEERGRHHTFTTSLQKCFLYLQIHKDNS